MKMSADEFRDILERELDVQVFYNHTTTEDIVNYPYIVLLDARWSSFFADDVTYYETVPYTIIIHSYDRDYELEASLKELLTEMKLPYTLNDIRWIQQYLFWQVSFNVKVM